MKVFLRELEEIGLVSFVSISKDLQPHVRSFEIAGVDGELDKVYFLTGNKKNVYSHLQDNNKVALNSFANGSEYRIEGEVTFLDDIQHLIDKNPNTSKLYEGRMNELVGFEVDITYASKLSFSEDGPTFTVIK